MNKILIKIMMIGILKTSEVKADVYQFNFKSIDGKEINFFKAGDAFMESNNGAPHYVKNVGKKPAILHVGVVSVVGIPTAINK